MVLNENRTAFFVFHKIDFTNVQKPYSFSFIQDTFQPGGTYATRDFSINKLNYSGKV